MKTTRAIAGYFGLLVLALLFVTHADGADKTFSANLQSYSSAPASAYINLVLTNAGADAQGRSNICVKSSGVLAVKQQVLQPKSDGTVTSTVAPRGDITCGGVTGATLYRVEIRQKAGATPDPSKDPLIAANLYAIDADFVLSTAAPTSAVPASSSIDFSTYALTRPFRILPLASFPTSCTPNEDRIQRSDPDTAGQVDYVCNAAGTGFDLVGDGGGGGGTTPDATNLVKGKLKLAGDLAGTADSPTVPGLAAKEATANKSTATDLGAGSPSNTLYPSQAAVKSYVDAGLAGKQASLGYTAENVANKSTATDLGAGSPSNTLYPSQSAVKAYIDAAAATKFNKPVSACNNATTDKIITSADGLTAVCATDQTGVAGSGITSLNTLTGATQTLAKVDDANVTLGINSSGTTHTFTLGWTGSLSKARQFATTVYNDQANTFGAFLQKFRAGVNFQLGDPTDFTKGVQFDVSSLSTATFRQIKVPDFDSTTCQLGSLDGQVCIWDAANQRYAAGDPIISPDQAAATSQSITATGALTAVDVTRHPLVLVTIRGTYAGVAATFEASPDATNYFTAQAVRVDSAAIETTTGTLSSTVRAWFVNTAGMTRFRLNVSAYTSGTGSVTITPLGMTGGAQTVQVSSSALPSGAATESTLSTLNGKIPASPSTDRTTAAAPFAARLTDGAAFYKPTTPSDTQPVSCTNCSGTVSENLGQVGGNSVTTTDNGTQATAPVPTASSTAGALDCNVASAATTNATSCKASAGNFYGYEIYNSTTTVYYLRLYNTASAPTCSSATGFIRSIPIPPAGSAGQVNGAISNQQFPTNYSTGIGFCITGGSSSTDNTSAATGLFVTLRYK
jgi:hypothetical protein